MFLKAWTTDWCQSKNSVVQWDSVHDEITVRLSYLSSTQGRKVGPWPRMTRDVGTQALSTQMSMSEAAAATSEFWFFLCDFPTEISLTSCLFRYVVKKMWIILPARWGCYSVRIFSLGFMLEMEVSPKAPLSSGKILICLKRNKEPTFTEGWCFPPQGGNLPSLGPTLWFWCPSLCTPLQIRECWASQEL